MKCYISILLVLFSPIITGCGQENKSPFDIPVRNYDVAPNVLLITIDTCRADRLGCYGFPFAHTQSLDSLATDGVRCDNAIAAAPITLPSHSTILTGLLPPAHGVRDNGAYALSDEATTLAEYLKDSGYSTHAIVSAEVLNQRYNLTQGFDEYIDDLWEEDKPPTFMIRDRAAQKTAMRAMQMLDRWNNQPAQDAKPFFMWMHLFDPHQPWVANVPNKQMFPSPYDAEIAQADDGIEAVTNWLRDQGILDNTLVIVTADHGESLGEHGEETHSIFVYDATVKIPMVWRFPAQLPRGVVVDAPVHQADIVPTILAMLNIPGGDATQGRDLTAILKGETSGEARPQYSESMLSEVGFGMAPLYAVRHEGYKYIEAPRPELYDLNADPQELNNLYTQEPERSAKLKAILDTLIADSEAMALSSVANPMDETTLEMLEALGYLSSEEDRKSMGGMDPKDGIVLHKMLADARHHIQKTHFKKAEELLRKLLKKSPDLISAHNTLGLVLWKQKRLDEAGLAYGDSLAINPNQDRVLFSLGRLKLEQEDFEEAKQFFEQAVRLQPRFVEPMVHLSYTAKQQGDSDNAAKWNDEALTASSDSQRVNLLFAQLHYKHKQYDEALHYYQEALKLNPDHYVSLIEAGVCYLRTHRYAESIPVFEHAQAIRPDSWEAPYDLACAHALTNNAPAAIEALRDALNGQEPNVVESLLKAMANDSDLNSLQKSPEFDILLKEYSLKSKE